MGEKEKLVTIMVLKVDLQCEKCYKKVKKVLCKFPQIRDQTYDEKNNLVIIKVVCCSPEKIRDKLCCKGGGAIKSIDIKVPEKKPKEVVKETPKEVVKSKEKPKEAADEKPKELKEAEKPKEESKRKPAPCPCPCPCPVPAPAPCPCPCPVPVPAPCPCPVPAPAPRPCPLPAPAPCPVPAPAPRPCPVPAPAPCPVPVNTCCMECYGGHPGGPCQTGYGYGGPAPYIQYDGYYGRPVYDSYGGGRSYATSSSYCVTRPDCFSEENPQACAIM